MKLSITVIPRSSKTEITEQKGNSYRIKLKSAPDKGKANAELLRFLAREFKIAQSEITILRGKKSRKKIIHINALDINK